MSSFSTRALTLAERVDLIARKVGHADPHDWKTTHGWPFRYFGQSFASFSLSEHPQFLTMSLRQFRHARERVWRSRLVDYISPARARQKAHTRSCSDPHDSLYPRASTRLGNKFQCIVPEWDPTTKSEIAPPGPRNYFQPKKSRASTPSVAPNGVKDKDKETDWSEEKEKSADKEKKDKEKDKEKEPGRKKSGELL